MKNKQTCKLITDLYPIYYPEKRFLLWDGSEPHKPDLAAAFMLKIDPYLSSVGRQSGDDGPVRVLWMNTGVPLDIIMTAFLYNTLEGK